MHITDDEMDQLPFLSFHKTALLKARLLTEEDYQERCGVILTPEGSVSFQPGDYLARGIQDEEWPITREHFATSFIQVSGSNEVGFASYRATDICQAYQMPRAFTVSRSRGDTLIGKAGDYLVRSGNRAWIVDRIFFENSYERLP